MFSFIKRKLMFLTKSVLHTGPKPQTLHVEPQDTNYQAISPHIQQNFESIHNVFGNTTDLVIRRFTIGNLSTGAMVVNLNGMSKLKLINDNIIGTLMRQSEPNGITGPVTMEYLKDYQPLILPMMIITVTSSAVPSNVIEVIRLDSLKNPVVIRRVGQS